GNGENFDVISAAQLMRRSRELLRKSLHPRLVFWNVSRELEIRFSLSRCLNRDRTSFCTIFGQQKWRIRSAVDGLIPKVLRSRSCTLSRSGEIGIRSRLKICLGSLPLAGQVPAPSSSPLA